jgi:hypothetical protein
MRNRLSALGKPIHVVGVRRGKAVIHFARFPGSLDCVCQAANGDGVGHNALPLPAGGSASGLSVTDAWWVAVGDENILRLMRTLGESIRTEVSEASKEAARPEG